MLRYAKRRTGGQIKPPEYLRCSNKRAGKRHKLSTGGKAEQAQERSDDRQSATAYRSIRVQLEYIAWTEARWDKEARKRTGVTQPARSYDQYGKKAPEHPAAFAATMQRLWDIGTIDQAGRGRYRIAPDVSPDHQR
jgi:hypothetical protein